MARTKLFISYSHRDRGWLEQLKSHLALLERRGLVQVWSDTRIQLPRDASGQAFRHVFTGATLHPESSADGASIAAAALFEHFPVALLVPCST